MKKKANLIAVLFETALLIVIVLLGFLVIFSTKGKLLGCRILVVRSGSMEPAIKTGSLILVKANEGGAYSKGEIVTFGSAADPKRLVTHRIYEVEKKDGQPIYTTKGDANDGPDPKKVRQEQVAGKYLVGIPWIGFVVGFAQTPLGVTLLIVIPATILIYSEILNIKKEIEQRFVKKKE